MQSWVRPLGGCASNFIGLELNNVAYSVIAGDQYYLQMVATGSANIASGTGGYTALADPTISIDPNWLASHPGCSLAFSSNVSPVPLPPPSG